MYFVYIVYNKIYLKNRKNLELNIRCNPASPNMYASYY